MGNMDGFQWHHSYHLTDLKDSCRNSGSAWGKPFTGFLSLVWRKSGHAPEDPSSSSSLTVLPGPAAFLSSPPGTHHPHPSRCHTWQQPTLDLTPPSANAPLPHPPPQGGLEWLEFTFLKSTVSWKVPLETVLTPPLMLMVWMRRRLSSN